MGLGLGRRGMMVMAGALAACARNPGVAEEIDVAAVAEMARRPEDYVNGEARAFSVSRDGRPAGLLWGTWHVGYDEATVMPRAIRRWFGAASSLSVEVVLDRVPPPVRRAMAVVTARGLYRADPGAVARLDRETRRSLAAAGLPSESFERYSLVGLTQLVSARATAAPAGVLPQVGFVDLNLIGFARSIDVPVRGLEKADPALLELLRYADPNGEGAAAMLRFALRRVPGAPELVTWLRRRYAAGAIGLMAAGLSAWRAEAVDLARADRDRGMLLTARNVAWMAGLEETLAEPGVAFVAFGAAHLTGADGIVALLRERGWDVAACVGDRCSMG